MYIINKFSLGDLPIIAWAPGEGGCGRGGGAHHGGLAAARLRKGLLHLRGISGIVGSTVGDRGGALDGLAVERLRRAPCKGPSARGAFPA